MQITLILMNAQDGTEEEKHTESFYSLVQTLSIVCRKQ